MNWEVRTMQSRTSFFNGTLFRKNLTRFWPLWGLSSFVGALFPLALLLQLMRSEHFYMWNDPLSFTEMYYNVAAYAVPVISLMYAVLCAEAVWSYLYNSRSVGLAHTLPIRREGLFFTNFLSGMAMMLIPYVVIGALCVLVSAVGGCFDLKGLIVTILTVLGLSFFYFASATLVAFITGNVFALPAVYFLLHFLAVLLDWLVSTFAQGFLFGLSGGYTGVVEWLSPTVYLENQVRVNSTYETITTQTSRLTAVSLENFWLIGVYALVGVVLLVLAWLLYRRRRSESAGDVVAVGWMKPVFRFGTAALAALLGGIALYELFWRNFQGGQYYDVLPMVVCMLVAGAIGYYAASMLLAKSLKVFRGSWKGMALVAAGCVALCCVLHFDLLGVEDRVPEVSQVKKVHLYTADNNYTFYPEEDAELLEQVRTVHQAIVADKDFILNGNERRLWALDTGDIEYVSFDVTYELTNGLEVERNYGLTVTRDRMAQAGTYDNLLDSLVNSEAMKAKRLHVGDSRYEVSSGYLYLEAVGEHYDLNSREAAAILEAVGKDARTGAWGTYNWFENDRRDCYAMSLELSFTYTGEEEDLRRDWIEIYVRPGMDHTIACLKDLGLVTDEALRTYGELYPEDYMDYVDDIDYGEYVEKYGIEVVEDAGPASVGVIGGADGPTTVVVAGVTA